MAPTTQTAVQVTKFDAGTWTQNIRVVHDAAVPAPAAGEVLMRVVLRPINPADCFCIMGVYPGYQPTTFPSVPGMEGMGVVEAQGPGATKFAVGTRVTAPLWPKFKEGQGLWQQYITIPEADLVAVPDDITDDAAACAIINPVPVLGMLDAIGPVPADGYIAITAAGSALGRMALRLCKHRGIKAIGIVRRRETFEELIAEGATEMVCLSDEDVVARVMEITGGRGAWGVMECMCGDMVGKMCKASRIGGKVMLYGAMTSAEATIHVADTLFKNVAVQGIWVQLQLEALSQEGRQALVDQVWELFRKGIFVSGAGPEYSLDQVAEALAEHSKPGRAAAGANTANKCMLRS